MKHVILVDFDGTLAHLYSEFSLAKQVLYGLPLAIKAVCSKQFWVTKTWRKKLAYTSRSIEHGLVSKSETIQGAKEFINWLDEHPDIVWAVVSNNSFEVIHHYFDEHNWVKPSIIVGRHPEHKYMKPHPKPVLDALQALQVGSPEHVYMVGNTLQDVGAANRSGKAVSYCLAPTDKHARKLLNGGAYAVFPTMEELHKHLSTLAA